MIYTANRPSLAWTLFLLFLLTTQVQDSEAGMNLKLKKLLKRVLLLRALAGKKGITIIPIPIPLNLFMKDKMEKMPEPMPPYPMYLPSGGDNMMGYEMMMPKENDMMPHQDQMMNKGMMGGD